LDNLGYLISTRFELTILLDNDILMCAFIDMCIDDMLSLRNFYAYIIILWSSQGNLSSKKSKKKQEN